MYSRVDAMHAFSLVRHPTATRAWVRIRAARAAINRDRETVIRHKNHAWVTSGTVVVRSSTFWTFTRIGCNHLRIAVRDSG